MNNAARLCLRMRRRSVMPIFDRDTEDLMELLNANNYQKGAWVLHMLRSNWATTRSSAAFRELLRGAQERDGEHRRPARGARESVGQKPAHVLCALGLRQRPSAV
jgi:hypothetical protein